MSRKSVKARRGQEIETRTERLAWGEPEDPAASRRGPHAPVPTRPPLTVLDGGKANRTAPATRRKGTPRGAAPAPGFIGMPRPAAYATLAGAFLGVVMIAMSLVSVSAATRAPVTPVSGVNQSDQRSLGSSTAPVAITEWIDLQCPACRSFVLSREPTLRAEYIDTGKVRFISRNFPFLGPESFLAAEAADAAADQGRYWDYRNLLFARQQAENSSGFSPDRLKAFAAELGLDQKAFDDALDQGKYRAAVQAEVKEGDALGVKATPTLFIDGRKIEGVPTMDQLRQTIDAELAKKP